MISLLFQVVKKYITYLYKNFKFPAFYFLGGSPVPSICGTNTGAHMYIDMGLGNILMCWN